MKIVIPINREENTPYYLLRGGGWSNGLRYLRVATRSINDPSDRYDDYGFRIVKKKA